MELKHKIPSLEELRESRPMIRNTRHDLRLSLSPLERFAVIITRRVGSMGFFIFLFFWTVVWLGWNLTAPLQYRFDPAPAFVIWLFVSNILQLILLPLIMVGQNIEGRAADKRAQQDFDINVKAAREVEVIIGHLENQNELLLQLVHKIDRAH